MQVTVGEVQYLFGRRQTELTCIIHHPGRESSQEHPQSHPSYVLAYPRFLRWGSLRNRLDRPEH